MLYDTQGIGNIAAKTRINANAYDNNYTNGGSTAANCSGVAGSRDAIGPHAVASVAGGYQLTRQGGGNPVDAAAIIAGCSMGAVGCAGQVAFITRALADNGFAISITEGGYQWGDNPGDSMRIMEGWRFQNDR